MVLERLGATDEPLTTRELSESIAAQEAGEQPPPRNVRQSVYISLQQTHLPKLAELDIVEYDENSKEVRPAENASDVGVYMEVVPKYGLAWSEYYAGLGILGLLLVTGAQVGVPGLQTVGAGMCALFVFGLLVASALYQTVTQRRSLVHRLRNPG